MYLWVMYLGKVLYLGGYLLRGMALAVEKPGPLKTRTPKNKTPKTRTPNHKSWLR